MSLARRTSTRVLLRQAYRRRKLAFVLLLPVCAGECSQKPAYSASANFSADMSGTPDTRANTWGTAGATTWQIHFFVPEGDRVRIMRVYGDFLIWPKGKVPDGTYAGALFSLHTSSPDTPVSTLAPLMVDNCFLYLQLATGGHPERAAFDTKVSAGGLLESDNTLFVKVAVWLNDTGLPIHMEPTFVAVFQVQDASGSPVNVPTTAIATHGAQTERITLRLERRR